MKRKILFKSFLAALSVGLIVTGCAQAQSKAGKTLSYPHELPGFKFYRKAKWKSLEPLASTIADVRRVLGKPGEEIDLSDYFAPYPGDAAAKNPVLKYSYGTDWEILIYFSKPQAQASAAAHILSSIDLIPDKRIPFGKLRFPSGFQKRHVRAVDGAWDEYSDGTGLVYAVYTHKPQYSDQQAGDLYRIRYKSSQEAIAEFENQG